MRSVNASPTPTGRRHPCSLLTQSPTVRAHHSLIRSSNKRLLTASRAPSTAQGGRTILLNGTDDVSAFVLFKIRGGRAAERH